MISRSQLLAVLVFVEAAILVEMVVAIRGGQPAPWFGSHSRAVATSGSHLAEGGAHQTFAAGPHPALTVDIGYADLTIRTSDTPHVDVSVSKGGTIGLFASKSAIAARKDGDTVRVERMNGRDWGMGDNRMVTVVVPPQTQVSVVNAGDIKVNGLRAEASLHSVGSGDLTVEDYDGPALHVATTNGDISLLRVAAPRLEVSSRRGDVVGSALQVRNGSVETNNGDVTLGIAAVADTLVTAQTNHGTVNVSGVNATAPGTRATGDEADTTDEASSRSVRIGSGSGRLDVRSSNGNIRIRAEAQT